jgi:vacuolar-type H+-ATPase subunit E/Vma4
VSVSETQTIAALLERVEHDRDRRIDEIRARAEAEAEEIVRAARSDAARRVREAVRAERDRARRRLEAARAEISGRERERDRALAAALLASAWGELSAELERRFGDPEQRARWTRALLEQALTLLPSGPWTIVHPPALDAAELEALERELSEKTGHEPRAGASESIVAGLRFEANGTVLDGTIGGLLARRDEVEGELLAELFRAREGR